METTTYCSICDADDVATHDDVCAACWLTSLSPGGVHDDRVCLLTVEDDPPERLTIGEFIADNPDVLTEDDAVALMVDGETIALGGGAAPGWTLRIPPEEAPEA